MKIGSLFSGYGGLDMGVQSVIGGEVAWHVEFDEAPSKILAHHWPDVPNYGDITTVDWSGVEPVDVLTGGFPCQDVSLAGGRAGLRAGTRSGLWSEFARAINALHPQLVVIENVRGLLSAEATGVVESDAWGLGDGPSRPTLRALGAVLGDLADLGYDAEWCGIRAADAGAPHGRFRVFIVAHPQGVAGSFGDRDDVCHRGGPHRREQDAGRSATEDSNLAVGGEWGQSASGEAEGGRSRADAGRRGGAPAPDSNDGDRHGRQRQARRSEVGGVAAAGRGDGAAANSERFERERRGDHGDMAGSAREGSGEGHQWERDGDASLDRSATDWGAYEPAIRRWEVATYRVAPAATEGSARNGAQRLSAVFVEWMMGLALGHVTDPAIGLTRNQQLKALGNGVVPQQAALALRMLLKSHWAVAA